ncbi:hypothetical protein AgCh_000450 [Apium graveolens]
MVEIIPEQHQMQRLTEDLNPINILEKCLLVVADAGFCYFAKRLVEIDNSDETRDLDKPLKKCFYLLPLPPTEAAVREKDSAKDILNVKELIDKKAWPYVQTDLRSKAS